MSNDDQTLLVPGNTAKPGLDRQAFAKMFRHEGPHYTDAEEQALEGAVRHTDVNLQICIKSRIIIGLGSFDGDPYDNIYSVGKFTI